MDMLHSMGGVFQGVWTENIGKTRFSGHQGAVLNIAWALYKIYLSVSNEDVASIL